jgi:2-polyprenyl-6-hydroxyphenyl methylase/3-demethylubiquinone-9 3-methyltransferase
MNTSTVVESKENRPDTRKAPGYETWFDRVGESWLANAPTVLKEETPVRLQYFHKVLSQGVKGLKMLDLGLGGMGTIAESLAREGAQITVIDSHRHTLELAQAHARKAQLDITFQQAENAKLPFADASFDVIYCFDMLEHAGPALDSWLSEVRRVLKPGGAFIYNCPNRTPVSKIMIIYIFEQVIRLNPPGHHNFNWFMKPEELRAAFARNGLTHQHQIGFMNKLPKPLAGMSVLTRQGAPGGFKLGKDDSLVYVGYATRDK